MTDVLFYGATERSAAMRHELPIAILGPFLLGIVEGRMHIMASQPSSPASVGRKQLRRPECVPLLVSCAKRLPRAIIWCSGASG